MASSLATHRDPGIHRNTGAPPAPRIRLAHAKEDAGLREHWPPFHVLACGAPSNPACSGDLFCCLLFRSFCRTSCTTLKPCEPLLVGVYRGIIIPAFHGWCRISSIHSMFFLSFSFHAYFASPYLSGPCVVPMSGFVKTATYKNMGNSSRG